MSVPFAFVRCNTVQTHADLARLENHGKGLGKTATERRCVTDGPRGLFWRNDINSFMQLGVGSTNPSANVCEAFEEHLDANDAQVRGATRIGLHMIVGVSPEWADGEGDDDDDDYRRNPKRNKRLIKLMETAIKWANKEFGGDDGIPAVFAARCDLDERSATNIDVFLAPIRPEARSGNNFVSARKAMEEFSERWGWHAGKSFIPMQDSWTRYASDQLRTHFRRGESVEKTKRQHLTPEQLKRASGRAEVDRVRLAAELEKLRAATKEAVAQGSIEPLLAFEDAERQRRLPKAPKREARQEMALA